MGLIRKTLSLGTAGAVDFRSDKERIARYTKQSRDELRRQGDAQDATERHEHNQRRASQEAATSTSITPEQHQMIADGLGYMDRGVFVPFTRYLTREQRRWYHDRRKRGLGYDPVAFTRDQRQLDRIHTQLAEDRATKQAERDAEEQRERELRQLQREEKARQAHEEWEARKEEARQRHARKREQARADLDAAWHDPRSFTEQVTDRLAQDDDHQLTLKLNEALRDERHAMANEADAERRVRKAWKKAGRPNGQAGLKAELAGDRFYATACDEVHEARERITQLDAARRELKQQRRHPRTNTTA